LTNFYPNWYYSSYLTPCGSVVFFL
jgi:hypothetical protein